MTHSFNVYIDESGDDGIDKFRRRGSDGGSSLWLSVGACIVRANRDLELVALRDRIREECRPKSQKRDLHFKEMNHNQRRRACQIIAGQPLRFSCVFGYKDTPDAANFTQKNLLYFYLTRYLIERVSWFCRDYRKQVKEGNGQAKITFSRRGGMNYSDFQNYLRRLQAADDTEIHWPVIDIDAVEAQDHSRWAALQIADIGVSAMTAALEPDPFGNIEAIYLKELKNNIYHRDGNYLSYGLKTLPKLENLSLTVDKLAAIDQFR